MRATIGEIIDRLRAQAAADIRVACIGRVVRWDPSKQEADVQPVVKRAYIDESGNRVAEAQPTIPCVPVLFPGGGGMVLTWPIQVGDEVLLVFSDEAIDAYLANGGGTEMDPHDDRAHHMIDAIAIPGMRSFAAPRQSVGAAVQIGTDGGSFQGVALGSTLKSFLDNLSLWLSGHTHPSSGAPPATTPPTPPAVESVTVRVTP